MKYGGRKSREIHWNILPNGHPHKFQNKQTGCGAVRCGCQAGSLLPPSGSPPPILASANPNFTWNRQEWSLKVIDLTGRVGVGPLGARPKNYSLKFKDPTLVRLSTPFTAARSEIITCFVD
ncbi:hypothetical protein OIU84_000436 [Salix udensis]|uniref:Uncharacterized protein n=1 Tax=Salix udensis TaxID=889485 RepID=A0AAD6L4W0_9ROSI|nr:hypothetical protein OIU84_000436 [Salix udensis]